MGQAKKRGTFEQRLALAVERNKVLEPELDRLMKAQVPPNSILNENKYNITKRKHLKNPLFCASILASFQASFQASK
jgi:hypothetical protein